MPSKKTDTENNPVVLDIGEYYTKVGVNGDSEPRAIIPTAIKENDGSLKFLFKHDHSRIQGYKFESNFRQRVHKFLSTVYFKHLQVEPRQHSVVICESLTSPSKLREAIADVLFLDFEVPSLMFVAHQLLACFTIARGTSLVVDCSYGESSALPVVQWTPLLWKSKSAPVGAAKIHQTINEKMIKYGTKQTRDEPESKIDFELSEKVIEDIKVKTCFVTTMERSKKLLEQAINENSEESAHISLTIPRVTYYIDGSTKIFIPGMVREESAEVLFEQDNERVSVTTIVLDCLLNSPVDSVKELASNILLIGGTTMLPGFQHRFLMELKEMVENEPRYKELLGECDFRIHKPPTSANLVSWLGASIFASMKEQRRQFITKEFYKNNKKDLPDWSKSASGNNAAYTAMLQQFDNDLLRHQYKSPLGGATALVGGTLVGGRRSFARIKKKPETK